MREWIEDNLYSILPSDEGYQSLKKRFIVYVSCIMVKHIKFFQEVVGIWIQLLLNKSCLGEGQVFFSKWIMYS